MVTIFFHFAVSFGLILNLGINKIVAIELAKKKFVHLIINQSIKFSIILALMILIANLAIFDFKNIYIMLIIFELEYSCCIFIPRGNTSGFQKLNFCL